MAIINLPDGFSEVQRLQNQQGRSYFRVKNEADQQLYLLKVLHEPELLGSTKFRHEFKTLRELNLPFTFNPLRHSEDESDSWILFENFEGYSLRELINQAKLDISRFLLFAISMSSALDTLHRKKIIHNAINPDDILFNPKLNEIRLCNFENCTSLAVESPEAFVQIKAVWNLTYISPEQSGRMNRSVDYRSDFYSLGVVLYEILVGHPPFATPDPLEMVHSHIARVPPAPGFINPALPAALSDIVMKLLAKNAEDRYQSAAGLLFDLQFCLDQWTKKKSIHLPHLGQNDHFDRLNIPEKLYGREQEVSHLNQLFERVAKGLSGIAAISGGSGIGKTALVHEIYKPLTQFRGYFISGKFDQLNRDIPYLPILDALRGLIKQIYAEPEEELANWKQEITKQMGGNARIITDEISELEILIGSQKAVQKLPAAESQNRFNNVFSEFIHIFARPAHPLVLFLDDVQWVDPASLTLLEKLVRSNKTSGLLIICAFRDNSTEQHKPFFKMFDEWLEQGLVDAHISLEALKYVDIEQMLVETLHSDTSKIGALASLIFEKTEGNPFFIRQFLKTLFDNQLLRYEQDSGTGYWQWDLPGIQKLGITENVVQLLMTKLEALPGESLNVIRLASCIGNDFDLKTLAVISENNISQTAQYLWHPLRQGLIIPESDEYKYVIGNYADQIGSAIDLSIRYRFLHDKIQQAAYELIPERERSEIHYKIGHLLLMDKTDSTMETELFEILHHLNRGHSLIKDNLEKLRLAYFNLVAGKKVKNSAAFEAAFTYLSAGVQLLGKDNWNTDYSLCWSLFSELSEVEYIIGHFQEAEFHFNELLNYTESKIDKARILITKVKLYTHIDKVAEALDLGIKAAALLNLKIPHRPSQLIVGLEFLKTRLSLTGKSIARLQFLPEMRDEEAKTLVELLSQMTTAAYFTGPEMIGYLNLKMMQLVLRYGNPESAPFVYSQYALLEGAGMGAYQRAFELGAVAMNLMKEHNLPYWKSKTYMTIGAIIHHWRKPMAQNLPILKQSYQAAIESGDVLYSLYANNFIIHTKVSMGTELNSLLKDIDTSIDYAQRTGHNYFSLTLYRQMIEMLIKTDISKEPPEKDEKLYLDKIRQAHDLSAEIQWYVCKIKTNFFAGDFNQAIQLAEQARPVQHGAFGQLLELEYRFFCALAITRVYAISPSIRQKTLRRIFFRHYAKIRKWSVSCQENFMPHFQLIEAERIRVFNRRSPALHYRTALQNSTEQGFMHIAAITCETAAEYYLQTGNIRITGTYLVDALHYYQQWGALTKIRQLRGKYERLLIDLDKRYQLAREPRTTAKQDMSSSIDIDSIKRSALALSSEIQLDKLLQTIMQILIANAGAQRGILLLQRDEMLSVEAEVSTANDEIVFHKNLNVVDYPEIAHAVIRYVQRSAETVVVNNAAQEDKFSTDPHIQNSKLRSMLCMPITNKQKLKGILYLENNLTEAAFTEDRIGLLKLLTNEMAISIENALLYEKLTAANQQLDQYSKSLEIKVEERTRDLQNRSDELIKTNDELEQTMRSLKNTQYQLIQSEKMASLGELTAGIAHEIKNPLNFVNNFAESSSELLLELKEKLDQTPAAAEALEKQENQYLFAEISDNLQRILHHGKRADGIIRSMMLHARGSMGQREPINMNYMLDEAFNLVYHGLRAQDSGFNIIVSRDYDPNLGQLVADPQELNRVLLNLINNACFAAYEKSKDGLNGQPEILLSTKDVNDAIEIKIRDNGMGIPAGLQDKIFNPFFTTKPAGKGTGLGLSISYDIICNKYGGNISFESGTGAYTEFLVVLPR